MARRSALAAVVLGIVAGCGGPGRPPAATAPGRVRSADRAHEYRSPRPPAPERVAAGAGAGGPVAAIEAFASAYINWSASTVAARLQALARASVGQARSAIALAAAEAAGDYELQRAGVSNQGTVEAVAPRPGHRDQYVVVTLERTSATDTTVYQGLRPAWHVALAAVSEVPGGRWVVSGWEPQT